MLHPGVQRAVKVAGGLLQAHSVHSVHSRSTAAQSSRSSDQEQLLLGMRHHAMQQWAAARLAAGPKMTSRLAAAQLSTAVRCCKP